MSSIKIFPVICSCHTCLPHGRRKSAAHTSSPPRCTGCSRPMNTSYI